MDRNGTQFMQSRQTTALHVTCFLVHEASFATRRFMAWNVTSSSSVPGTKSTLAMCSKTRSRRLKPTHYWLHGLAEAEFTGIRPYETYARRKLRCLFFKLVHGGSEKQKGMGLKTRNNQTWHLPSPPTVSGQGGLCFGWNLLLEWPEYTQVITNQSDCHSGWRTKVHGFQSAPRAAPSRLRRMRLQCVCGVALSWPCWKQGGQKVFEFQKAYR